MASLPILEVRALSKWFSLSAPGAERRLGEALSESVRRFLGRPASPESLPNSEEGFWALKNVSFAVQRGERIGLIGRNGSGKSTLLKLLARITAPSEGTATLRGRVSALLEVGAGLHPDISGRQNIFLYGTLIGMPRKEIQRNLDAIIDFSELSRFIHMPVKHYSTGMYLRLAFSVAAHLNPEILLVDEVLAVGDAEFQRKCRARLDLLTAQGVTLALVSHDLAEVTRLCHRALWLDGGRIRADGSPEDVIQAYQSSLS